jgi:hypothetical protein
MLMSKLLIKEFKTLTIKVFNNMIFTIKQYLYYIQKSI